MKKLDTIFHQDKKQFKKNWVETTRMQLITEDIEIILQKLHQFTKKLRQKEGMAV